MDVKFLFVGIWGVIDPKIGKLFSTGAISVGIVFQSVDEDVVDVSIDFSMDLDNSFFRLLT